MYTSVLIGYTISIYEGFSPHLYVYASDVVVDNDDACSDGLTQISKDEIMNKSCTQEAKF